MENNKYSKGKIYRLVNSVDDEEYIGSTCGTLAKRKHGHKQLATKRPNQPVYSHFNKIGFDNVSIVLIEEYPCNNKMELERRERYWIEQLKPTLNRYIPTRTTAEYCKDNADKRKEAFKVWYSDNKSRVSDRNKQNRVDKGEQLNIQSANFRANNPEYSSTYYQNNKDKIKERQTKRKNEINALARQNYAKRKVENAEKIQQQRAKYHAQNREAINARKREQYAQKKAERQAISQSS